MAVANFQYITRMSSGFKVYILEGKLFLLHFSLVISCGFRRGLTVLSSVSVTVMLFILFIVIYYLGIVTTLN